MLRGPVARAWRHDRGALVVLAVGAVVATVGWRGTTRPMADTPSYRAAAEVLAGGWESLTDRTPGYPLLLWLTGAADGSSPVLFAVQMALHVWSVVLVVDLARRAGAGSRARVALAVLMVAPPVMLRVLHEGTEGLSAWCLTAVAWLLAAPDDHAPRGRAWWLGATCAFAALVRPTFVLLWVPVAVLAAARARARDEGGAAGSRDRRGRPGLVAAGSVALPAVAVVLGLTVLNGVRFDSFGVTPLAPYHLSSRTSAYVEELPERYEPARSVLIAERDRALLRGEEYAPTNFIWEARPELERVTGTSGPELDRLVLEMDIHLITHNPFAYVDAVLVATTAYVVMDSQPAILGVGRPVVWVLQAAHLVLLALFVAVVAFLPGLGLARRLPAAMRWPLVVAGGLSAYVMAVSVMTESGTARLRSPTEPLLALVLVLGLATVRAARTPDGVG